MSDERLIECDVFSGSEVLQKSEGKLEYGQVYSARFYENKNCVFIGASLKRDVVRYVVVLKGKKEIRAFDFSEYILNGRKITVPGDKFRARSLTASERSYLASLLEEKLGTKSK